MLTRRERSEVALLIVCGAVGAQVEWTMLGDPHPLARAGHAMAYDSARGRTVLFGGESPDSVFDDTWEWDGARWSRQRPDRSPSPRTDAATAFHAARGRVVLFGGVDGTGQRLSDTWEWDGRSWTQRFPPRSPTARVESAMAYDARRGRTLLFGGVASSGVLADTWEWDGEEWTLRTPTASPTPRARHAMADDPAHGRIVLVGGDLSQPVTDTWEWDGSNWLRRVPVTSPPPRMQSALAFDAVRSRVVLHGGGAFAVWRADCWEWDGSDWRPTPGAPVGRCRHAMVFDVARGRLVLFGGWNASSRLGDTWERHGTDWVVRSDDVLAPGPRQSHGMAFDARRGRAVLFGGTFLPPGGGWAFYPETWEWNGSEWIRFTPAVAPEPRESAALAFDTARGTTILFGGFGQTSWAHLQDTWEWDGARWREHTPAQRPQVRTGHAVACDDARRRLLVFGGHADSGFLADTWEWDGSDWTLRTPTRSPPARMMHAMAFDARRARVVLFGGAVTTNLADTWEWDGADWLLCNPAANPGARSGHAMAYDSARERVVLFGGTANGPEPFPSDVWEWDGQEWLRRQASAPPIGRSLHALAFDATRGRMLTFGGSRYLGTWLADTWSYGPSQPARFSAFGAACQGSAGAPSLAPSAGRLPWLGDDWELAVQGVAAGGSALLLLGTSRTQWAGLPLPHDLASLGMPGCALFVGAEIVLPFVNAGGRWTSTVPIPADPSLRGSSIFCQSLLADREANRAGLVVSNAGDATLGGR